MLMPKNVIGIRTRLKLVRFKTLLCTRPRYNSRPMIVSNHVSRGENKNIIKQFKIRCLMLVIAAVFVIVLAPRGHATLLY